ncbi:MAG: aminodeoxychorismate/anthranilate synthase component II [Acidimicrobiia bacterium]
MPRVLVVDNYDSFTYNLVQYLGELGAEVEVVRNDEADPADLVERGFDHLVISPGPGRPDQAGRSAEFLERFGVERRIPTLGVCLGHQVIVEHFGGRVDLAPEPRHGKTSRIHHDGMGVFADLPQDLTATRYHSLAGYDLPDDLVPSARATDDDTLQGVRHRDLPIEGVQFHPEWVVPDTGMRMLASFLG